MNASNVWDEVLSRVEARGNSFTFSCWFRPVTFLSGNGEPLRVSVPNTLFRDWFLMHYACIVREILADL